MVERLGASLVLWVSCTVLAAACSGNDGTPSGSSGTAGSTPDGAAGSAGQAMGGSSGIGGSAGSSGSGGSAGASGSSGAASCDLDTHACVGDTPLNWQGPIAFYEGSGAVPGCPGAYPDKLGDYGSDLVAGSASCECTCSPASGIAGCDTGAAKIYPGPSGCTTPPKTTTLPVFTGVAGQCLSAGISDLGGPYWMYPPSPTSTGSCTPGTNHTLPPAQWANAVRSCKGGTPTAADCGAGKQCVPRAQDPYKLCVYQPGDVACPSALYSEKHTVYESFTDSRQCSECTCGAAQSACGGQVTLYSPVGTCSTGWGSLPPGCKMLGGYALPPTAKYVPNPTGSCAPSSSTLSGAVTTSGAFTVCCPPN